ncbi:KTSC domain-containing protein [Bradyrhizobium oligotrophicum S58]
MQMRNVTSSNIRAIGYDAGSQTLAVQFASGLYHYSGVPAEIDHALQAAEAAGESLGRFVAVRIRNRFPSTKASA